MFQNIIKHGNDNFNYCALSQPGYNSTETDDQIISTYKWAAYPFILVQLGFLAKISVSLGQYKASSIGITGLIVPGL